MKKTKLLLLGMLFGVSALAQTPGDIVFSRSPFGGGEAGSLSETFSAGDHIYAEAYYSAPLERLPITRKVTLAIKVFEVHPNGSESFLDYYEIGLTGAAMEATSLDLELAPDPATTKSYANPDLHFKTFGKKVDGPAALCDILAGLSPGPHTLILRLEHDDRPVANGQIVIDGADFSNYAGLAENLRKLHATGAKP